MGDICRGKPAVAPPRGPDTCFCGRHTAGAHRVATGDLAARAVGLGLQYVMPRWPAAV